jgi:outer membrane protein assembly factor BamB
MQQRFRQCLGNWTICAAALLAAADLRGEPDASVWPQFRGPAGDGHADAKDLPLTWSETSNIGWQTPIHGRGWSSPVVCGSQIWLTTATEDGHELFAVAADRATGRILHDLRIFHIERPQATHALNSYASPSPVIEEGRVYVHFGAHGTACLDTATGRTLWSRQDLACDHFRGPGSSPLLFEDLLILHFDGIDVQYLAALDKRTGRTVWKTDRSTDFGNADGDLRKAYSTPLLTEVGGRPQLISPGAKAAMAYDPHSGRELWKVRYDGFSNTVRPLAGHGLVFVNTGFGRTELWAIRPDGQGDVTESHVVWRANKSIPTKPSPVLVGDLLFMANDAGIFTCLEAKTGALVWQKRIGGQYSASPLYAAGRIYFFSHEGRTTVIAPEREWRVLAENQLDDGFMASPAVADGRLILRTKARLLCIGAGQ